MKLLTALRAERLKSKRTASVYLTLIGSAFVPFLFLLNVLTGGSDLKALAKDPLNSAFELGAERTGVLFFPLFVILVCTLLPQIEYRNNTWKQVFASPQAKASVFLAKFLNINRLLLLFLLAHLVFMAVAVLVMHVARPDLHLLEQPFDFGRVALRTGNMYVTMLAVCALQFWLGLRFRNFVVPTAVGFVLWVTGMMMALEFRTALVDYFPYCFHLFPLSPQLQPRLPQVAWTSAGYTFLFLGLGFLDFRRRRLTSA
ncbi:ABC transporter permease [Flaviaesturariibacter amylovorans]|uniref:ABC transporter permease n=1 Tax=Flaviaesturariibacter amylovorans TaxID=1084520 RepID=A0ABP8GEY0_9BACT